MYPTIAEAPIQELLDINGKAQRIQTNATNNVPSCISKMCAGFPSPSSTKFTPEIRKTLQTRQDTILACVEKIKALSNSEIMEAEGLNIQERVFLLSFGISDLFKAFMSLASYFDFVYGRVHHGMIAEMATANKDPRGLSQKAKDIFAEMLVYGELEHSAIGTVFGLPDPGKVIHNTPN
ncbi:hypothetical protein NEDG_00072 [Nematocida displodere]|uniref:Uncharacterized protein n=1 Tax=Nematocida displodere TaxID=1805483 RepID=A0A177EI31_9MICR|nr:hypothetical protein NEDG_00072 [Nematocida displodere]